MPQLFVSIAADDRTVAGVLAAEALRQAAAKRQQAIDIEVTTAQGVLNPLVRSQTAAGGIWLAVGDTDANDARMAGLQRAVTTLDAVLADAGAVLDRALQAPPSAAAATSGAPAAARIVAITSCPTGIAHTFMAAEAIEQAAKALGHTVKVETQGSVGSQNTLTDEDIAQADVVLIAADRQVDLSRFDGKRVLQVSTKPAIQDGQALIQRALRDAQVLRPAGGAGFEASAKREKAAVLRAGPYKHLMTGVSFMLPFITAGGLLIALSFALGGIYVFKPEHAGTLGYELFQIGAKAAFALIVPALSGYIAYSIADRPGIAPGMIGGMIASSIGAGFLGGIVSGFIAGYGTDWFNKHLKLNRHVEGLKPVLILPLLGTLLTGLLMIYVVGTPVAHALAWLTDWLKGMQGTSAILLGLLLGAMMAFDMGGPVNKAAYTFATGLLASQIFTPMAAVMAAGMTPPLGLALATRLFPNRFTVDEREAWGATGLLGLSFITEGAIPYAARDPLRVIPANMIGSAVAGAISMVAAVQLRVPHGGVFVLPIPNAVSHLGMYVVALAVGTVVSALVLGLLKKKVG